MWIVTLRQARLLRLATLLYADFQRSQTVAAPRR